MLRGEPFTLGNLETWFQLLKEEVRTWVRVVADVAKVAGQARTRASPRGAAAIITLQRASNSSSKSR